MPLGTAKRHAGAGETDLALQTAIRGCSLLRSSAYRLQHVAIAIVGEEPVAAGPSRTDEAPHVEVARAA